MSKIKLLQISVLSLSLFVLPAFAQDVFHVNINNGDDTNDGLKWSTAFKNLQQAIDAAGKGDTIKVAGGIYHPTKKITEVKGGNTNPLEPTDDLCRSFLLRKDLKIFGGFPSNATDATTMENRDWTKHQTILSGDFNNDDGSYFANTIENAYHVIVMINASSDMLIDGFHITGGGNTTGDISSVYVDNVLVNQTKGGGIYAMTSFDSFIDSSPILSNLVIRNNKVKSDGGGYYNYSNGHDASPTLINVTMINNVAEEGYGGAFYNDGLTGSNPKLLNVTISGNTALAGGGLYCVAEEESSPIFENVLISGNQAYISGGVHIFAMGADAAPEITNTTICGNKATEIGIGGLYIRSVAGEVIPLIKNSVIWGNKSIVQEYDNYYLNGNQGNNILCANNLIEGMDLGGTNLNGNVNPRFVNHIDADLAPTISNKGDYRLSNVSPLVNMGDNTFVTQIYDLAGKERIFGEIVDIGAYELQSVVISDNETITKEKNIWSYQGNIYVKVSKIITNVSIYSMNGMLVKQLNNLGEGTYSVTLTTGLYIVKLSTGETAKVIVN